MLHGEWNGDGVKQERNCCILSTIHNIYYMKLFFAKRLCIKICCIIDIM